MSRHRSPDDPDERRPPVVSRGGAPAGLFDPYPAAGYDEPHDGDEAYDPYGHPDRYDDEHPSGPLPASRSGRRSNTRRRQQLRRRRRVTLVVGVILLVVLGVGAWKLSGSVFTGGSSVVDYSGDGTGSATVTIQEGDGAAAIGDRLVSAGVIGSSDAFVTAAKANSASVGIQPGVYALRQHMSATSALNLLLDPSSRQTRKVVVPEGATEATVLASLASALGVPADQVTAAAQQVDQVGIPAAYGTPTSLEGFLFPATYSFDPGTTPLDALRQMVAQFIANDRDTGFSAAAAGLGLTPYQLLTAASIAQAEIKVPADAGKVVRVILNRIAIGRPLQVDPTSVYAARLAGVDPATIDYATYASPYNTYLNAGLPPGPIDNPGTDELKEAAAPDVGDWIYYVTGDAEGNLFFTADEAAFIAAAQNCADQGWGCADQGG